MCIKNRQSNARGAQIGINVRARPLEPSRTALREGGGGLVSRRGLFSGVRAERRAWGGAGVIRDWRRLMLRFGDTRGAIITQPWSRQDPLTAPIPSKA